MKKGYIIVIVFAFLIAILQSLKFRIFVKKDISEATLDNLILQVLFLFLILSIPGLLIVRWYYKLKAK